MRIITLLLGTLSIIGHEGKSLGGLLYWGGKTPQSAPKWT